MRKLLLSLLTLLSFAIPSYAQQGIRSHNFTIAGPDSAINLLNTSIAFHKLVWNVSGTASVCTVALDSSSDGITWSAGGVITGQTCTSNGSSSVVNLIANYVRINMTALTATAGSSVTVTWDGWVTNPGGGGVTSITATSPVVVTPSPLISTGVISCPTCNTSSATIAGSVANTQIAYGSGANTVQGDANHVIVSSGQTQLTAGADNVGVLQLNGHSATQSAWMLDVNNNSTVSPTATMEIRGIGEGLIAGAPMLLHLSNENNSPWSWLVTNKAAPAGAYAAMFLDNDGTSDLDFGVGSGADTDILVDTVNRKFVFGNGQNTVIVQTGRYTTDVNCSSAASPAVCTTAAAGSVVVAAGATTVVVDTTAVTANSQILLQFDASLGTKLGVTCNTTVAPPSIATGGRSAGVSFTITVPAAPVTNPACYSYDIIN